MSHNTQNCKIRSSQQTHNHHHQHTPMTNNSTIQTHRNRTSKNYYVHILVTGTIYFARVFMIAFVLGAIRVGLVVPTIGSELYGVLLELPILLYFSWSICEYVIAKQPHHVVTYHVVDRLCIGFIAFCYLMIAEYTMFRTLPQSLGPIHSSNSSSTTTTTTAITATTTVLDFIQRCISSPAHILGLFGQIVYAFIPAIQGLRAGSVSTASKGISISKVQTNANGK